MKRLILLLLVCFACMSNAFAEKYKVIVWAGPYGMVNSEYEPIPEVATRIKELIKEVINKEQSLTFSSKQNEFEKQDGFEIAEIFHSSDLEKQSDADLVIWVGAPDDDDSDNEWKINFIGIRTGREKTISIGSVGIGQFTSQNFKDSVYRKIKEGLRLAKSLITVCADDLINKEYHIVRYEVSALNGEDIFIDVDYGDVENNPRIQDVMVSLKNPPKQSNYRCPLLKSSDNNLDIIFYYTNGRFNNCRFVTEDEPGGKQMDGKYSKTYNLKSKKGYDICVVFNWYSNGEVEFVQIMPKINPYAWDDNNR